MPRKAPSFVLMQDNSAAASVGFDFYAFIMTSVAIHSFSIRRSPERTVESFSDIAALPHTLQLLHLQIAQLCYA